MRNLFKKSLLCIKILILIVLTSAVAQEDAATEEILTPNLRLSYTKKTDDSKLINAVLTYKSDAGISTIEGAAIKFYSMSDTIEKFLGKAVTGKNGTAIFIVPKDLKFPNDSVRELIFVAEFSGNDEYGEIKVNIVIRDLELELDLSIIDSVHTMSINTYTIGSGKTKVPLNEVDVIFYAKRLFYPLKIGEGWIENGLASAVFPIDLPGDSSGNVTVIAKIEEHDLYGNVEKSQTIKWGVKVPYVYTIHRGLGDVDAPLWMVYTLITLLSIVWLHFLYVIISVMNINKIGKKVKESS